MGVKGFWRRAPSPASHAPRPRPRRMMGGGDKARSEREAGRYGKEVRRRAVGGGLDPQRRREDARGGVVAEVDTELTPRVGDLVACSTAETCPSAPQIAQIRHIDREAGTLEVRPLDRALNAASVRFDARPEDGITVDGVVAAVYAPVYVRGEGGGWYRA